MEKTQLGLKANWKQFALLLLINGFVGGMIGMERSIFPEFASSVFGIDSHTAILSFIAAFGINKAFTNYFTGKWANRFGRRNLLITGWIIALPIPFILISADSWWWVIVANILLGISQGLAWSSTVVMKIDLVGEKDRGFAMGLNEFAGYLAVALVAFISGYIAAHYGITPYPFYLGIGISIVGLLLTVLFVKDTRHFVHTESKQSTIEPLKNVFLETSFTNKTLSSITQAGLVNNLNDGMIWGLFPVLLFSLRYDAATIGMITAIYPGIWSIGQLFTGKMADHYSKKAMLFWGMLVQGVAIVLIPASAGLYWLIGISITLGLGTALVYPTFMSAIAAATTPAQRAESLGTFRLWRDLGYAFGSIISGITADLFGVEYAILLIGLLTLVSALIIKFRIPTEPTCITKSALQALMKHTEITVIDVRSREEYDRQHVPEAIHIPLIDLSQNSNRISRHILVVTVCGNGGGRSDQAAYLLRKLNFDARPLCGGTSGWFASKG